MSIESTQSASQPTGVSTDFKARAAAKQADAPRESQGDSTGITENARELGRAHDAADAAPDVREDRVRALRAAIANGTYETNSEEVARRLLDRGF